jgi:hypothetical protein
MLPRACRLAPLILLGSLTACTIDFDAFRVWVEFTASALSQ